MAASASVMEEDLAAHSHFHLSVVGSRPSKVHGGQEVGLLAQKVHDYLDRVASHFSSVHSLAPGRPVESHEA